MSFIHYNQVKKEVIVMYGCLSLIILCAIELLFVSIVPEVDDKY